jgi:uncharacterized protein (TIGR03083 family)
MQQPGRDQFFTEIRASAAQLADIASTHDPSLPVPTCPDWTLRQLATHVGRVHRWAAEIVATRAAERIPFDSAPDGRYPAGPAEQAAWLNAGAERVITAIGEAGEEPVWAFGQLAPASFWARRQAHETMMHRADAELAAGRDVMLDAGLAADGIDEWLASVTDPRYRQRGDGSAALPVGADLHLRVTGAGPAGSGPAGGADDWVVSSTPAGLAVQRGPAAQRRAGEARVTVSGPADRLLLVLVRRRPADDQAITVTGDRALLTGWLAGTPF